MKGQNGQIYLSRISGTKSAPDCRNLTIRKFLPKTAAKKTYSTPGLSGCGGGGDNDDVDNNSDGDGNDDGGDGVVGVWRRVGSTRDVPCIIVGLDVGLVEQSFAKGSLEADEEDKEFAWDSQCRWREGN